MISLQIGDIYEHYLTYKDNPSQGKTRPFVVIQILDENKIVAAAAITSKNNNSRFSHVKLPIINWRSKETGLTSMSWVIPNDIQILEIKRLKKRLGRMHPLDFQRLIETISTL